MPRPVGLAIVIFVLAITVITTLARMPGPLYDDIAEAYAWGQQLEFGYYKHPPYFAWVTRAWFEVFPRTSFFAYLLGGVNAGIGLWGVWAVSGLLLPARARVLALAMLMATPHWTFMATRFNANTALLVLWPWATWALLRSLEDRSVGKAALFGIFAGLAMMSKYVSALFLVSCAAAALMRADRWRYLASPAPYISVGVAALIMAPHAYWSLVHGMPTIEYAMEKTYSPADFNRWKAVKTALAFFGMLAPVLLVTGAALGRDSWGLFQRKVLAEGPGREPWLWVLAWGPAVLIVLIGLSGKLKIATDFFIPTVFLIPILWLRAAAPQLGDGVVYRAWRCVGVLGLIALLCAVPVSVALFRGLNKYASTPAQEAAMETNRLWREAFQVPLKLVTGTERYSLGLTFYAPDRPAEFTHFSMAQAPWVTPERLAREGLAVACERDDQTCLAQAKQYQTGRSITREIALASNLYGIVGPQRKLVIILTPPN